MGIDHGLHLLGGWWKFPGSYPAMFKRVIRIIKNPIFKCRSRLDYSGRLV
jgi:hypothetical protein